MKLLIIANRKCDLADVLQSCGAETKIMTEREVIGSDISGYDRFAVLAEKGCLEARARLKIENECDKGKRIFYDGVTSFRDFYCGGTADTTKSRLIVVDECIGLELGDLLDDESNSSTVPYFPIKDYKPILVYKNRIIAHTHLDGTREEYLKDSRHGLWMYDDHTMVTSFRLLDFNKARFAPRESWKKVIFYIAEWLTGNTPAFYPEPVCEYGVKVKITDGNFEKLRINAIKKSIKWMKNYVIEDGKAGVMEGNGHNVAYNGALKVNAGVRADCTGEVSGALWFYGKLFNDEKALEYAANTQDFNYTYMQIKGGRFDGMLRWSDTAWTACYQDDVARAVLLTLYMKKLFGIDRHFENVEKALDFLVKTTAKNGNRKMRTDNFDMTEEKFKETAEAEKGLMSAHYNAYYHAALLLAYQCGGKEIFLETARKGLEALMEIYPETAREQSETEEMARLVLPLALLYDVTKEEKHREMLYRVTNDLESHKHQSGAILEWDTGYKADCSRESTGECSVLTENGDPVVDMLYTVNWLPIGFAFAYKATGDGRFEKLWRDIVGFFISAQIRSKNKLLDGSWTRAFDVNLKEAYAAPHDAGWAPYANETGWTVAEIAMGMMMPDIMKLAE